MLRGAHSGILGLVFRRLILGHSLARGESRLQEEWREAGWNGWRVRSASLRAQFQRCARTATMVPTRRSRLAFASAFIEACCTLEAVLSESSRPSNRVAPLHRSR